MSSIHFTYHSISTSKMLECLSSICCAAARSHLSKNRIESYIQNKSITNSVQNWFMKIMNCKIGDEWNEKLFLVKYSQFKMTILLCKNLERTCWTTPDSLLIEANCKIGRIMRKNTALIANVLGFIHCTAKFASIVKKFDGTCR